MQERSPKTAEDLRRTVDDATQERSDVDASSQGDVLVIPVVAEELAVETARVARGAVRLHKRVETSKQTVDTPLVREDVIVERVAVNRPVEGAPWPLTSERRGAAAGRPSRHSRHISRQPATSIREN